MTLTDLTPIKARLEAAPPRPWKVVGENYCLEGFPQVEYADERGSYIRVHKAADAHFIANAPTDLAALISEVEALREWQRRAVPLMTTALCSHHKPGDECRWDKDAQALIAQAQGGEGG